MSNLIKAQEARKNKALDARRRFHSGVSSFRSLISSGVFTETEEVDVPKVKWNRSKYSRMNYAEQAEYEARMKETKKRI